MLHTPRIHGARAPQPRLFLGCQLNPDFSSNGAGHLALHRQDVSESAVVASRPEMAIGAGIDELRRDADFLPRAIDGACTHGIYTPFLSDISQCFLVDF